jgi:hypothetical protein
MEKIAKRIIAQHNARSVELFYAGGLWHAKAMPDHSLAHSQLPDVLRERGVTSISLDEMTAILAELLGKPLAAASHETAAEALKLLLDKLLLEKLGG